MDLEWDPERTDERRLQAVGWSGSDGAYATAPGNVPSVVWDKIASDRVGFVSFTKQDVVELLNAGYNVRGPLIDLQVAAWVLNENRKLSLDKIVRRYLKRVMDKRVVRVGKRAVFRCDDGELVPISRAPRSQLNAYCRRDVREETDLCQRLVQLLQKRELWEYFVNDEVPFTRVLVGMERAGMPIDLKASERLRKKYEEQHEQLKSELLGMGELPSIFNLNSDDQVRDYLFSKKGVIRDSRIPVGEKAPKGFHPDPSREGRLWQYGEWRFKGLGLDSDMLTDKSNLPSVSRTALMMNAAIRDHSWVQKFLEYNKIDKLLTTYLRVFPEVARDGRIYAHFNQTGTRTGRLSSSDPNMQNIPKRGEIGKEVRGLFRVPDRDLPFLRGDYGQLELRIIAHFSEDPVLMRIFKEGRDPFNELATDLFGKPIDKGDDERSIMKNLTYAMNFGAYEDKLSEMLTMEGFPTSVNQALGYLEGMRELLEIAFDWRDDVIADARDMQYVTTLAGRKRRIEFSKATSWKETSHGERMAANAKVQGSAMDVVRRTMCRYWRPALVLCLQVHDELAYQYIQKVAKEQRRHDARLLKRMAETGHGFDLKVPLVFEPRVTVSWGD